MPVHITPETVTASPDVNDVTEEATLTAAAAHGVLTISLHDALPISQLHVTTTGPLAGSLGGTLVMAADGSYSYNPTSIPTLETLSLGDHVETSDYHTSERQSH